MPKDNSLFFLDNFIEDGVDFDLLGDDWDEYNLKELFSSTEGIHISSRIKSCIDCGLSICPLSSNTANAGPDIARRACELLRKASFESPFPISSPEETAVFEKLFRIEFSLYQY